MPFVRFSRDKRGYEHVYLVEASRGRGAQAHVLYWFRTPPGLKVGREPFDEAVRRALESQNPHTVFDWKQIASTPKPPPDAEHWRERRKAERAMKKARVADSDGDEQVQVDAAPVAEAVEESPDRTVDAGATGEGPAGGEPAAGEVVAAPDSGDPPGQPVPGQGQRRRRRRGGRHRRRGPGAPGTPPGMPLEPSALSGGTGQDSLPIVSGHDE